jgi:hypothetical protein
VLVELRGERDTPQRASRRLSQERLDPVSRPRGRRLADELKLDSVEQLRLEGVQCRREGFQPLSLVEATEERKPLETVVAGRGEVLDGLAGRTRACEVGDDKGPFRQAPALAAHPVEEIRARADDDVREFDRRLLVHAECEHMAQIRRPEVRRDVEHIAPRSVAEDDEQCVVEREACLAKSQCCIRRRAEVRRDDDVRRILAQPQLDAPRVEEVPRLDGFLAGRRRPNADPGIAVDRLPVRVDRLRPMDAEEDLDGITHPRERQREERCGSSHPACRDESAKLVRDDRHAPRSAGRVHERRPVNLVRRRDAKLCSSVATRVSSVSARPCARTRALDSSNVPSSER